MVLVEVGSLLHPQAAPQAAPKQAPGKAPKVKKTQPAGVATASVPCARRKIVVYTSCCNYGGGCVR